MSAAGWNSQEDLTADTGPIRPDPPNRRGGRRPPPAHARSRRLVLGAVAAVPLAVAIALAAVLGGTAAFLVVVRGPGAAPATDPASPLAESAAASMRHGGPLTTTAVTQVATSGATVVAVGSQDSVTPSFLFSADGGRTWAAAVTRSQAGLVAGHQATMVAGGPGGWVGLGPSGLWSSANGRTWTLTSDRGLAASGETITGLTKDSWGYLATGTSAGPGTGLVWTSPNGVTWHKFTAAQFGLVNAPGEQVFAMTDAATDWSVTLIAGSAHKGGKTCSYVWRSLNDGASWRTVVVPQTNGGSWSFAGLAGNAGHFIAVRPGTTAGGQPEAVVYTSNDAVNWRFAATIAGGAGFAPQQVTAGAGAGHFVVTGRDSQGHAVAYASSDNGATWSASAGLGVIPSA